MNIEGVHLGLNVISAGDSLLIPASVTYNENSLATTVFIDSKAAGNFLDITFARLLQIPMSSLEFPVLMLIVLTAIPWLTV